MSKNLNLWINETGEEKFKNFLTSLDKENPQKHATTIYRNCEQSYIEKYFMYNKIGSGAVVIGTLCSHSAISIKEKKCKNHLSTWHLQQLLSLELDFYTHFIKNLNIKPPIKRKKTILDELKAKTLVVKIEIKSQKNI